MRAVVGRDRELDEIRSFLDLEEGVADVLLIQGVAGIGKTTLWQAGIEAARERSFRVLAASPSAAETGMSFAALGDLLGDAADEVLAALPAPQRRALEVALLLREAEGSAPDQRAVAAAVLGALRTLSLSHPVLLAVDDVQWLDAASAATLAYGARRLGEERVGLLLAQRVADGEALPLGLDRAAAEHVTSLRVGPLSLGATHRLLRERLGVALPRPVLRRVHETAGGNPFYALEIARVLPLERMVAGQPLPVPASLGELVRGRVAALPPEVQQVLAVAAALSEPRLAVVEAALDRDPRPALREASEVGVVAVEDGRIRFVHPLLASAAYALPGEADRRAVHRRLVAAVTEPEERARHLALAADGASEEVAAELESAALGAGARAAVAAATASQCRIAWEAVRIQILAWRAGSTPVSTTASSSSVHRRQASGFSDLRGGRAAQPSGSSSRAPVVTLNSWSPRMGRPSRASSPTPPPRADTPRRRSTRWRSTGTRPGSRLSAAMGERSSPTSRTTGPGQATGSDSGSGASSRRATACSPRATSQWRRDAAPRSRQVGRSYEGAVSPTRTSFRIAALAERCMDRIVPRLEGDGDDDGND